MVELYHQNQRLCLAGDEGFEPPILGPEPSALPLGQSPSSKCDRSFAILPTKQVCSAVLAILRSLLLSKSRDSSHNFVKDKITPVIIALTRPKYQL
jgi:hypothetical protein